MTTKSLGIDRRGFLGRLVAMLAVPVLPWLPRSFSAKWRSADKPANLPYAGTIESYPGFSPIVATGDFFGYRIGQEVLVSGGGPDRVLKVAAIDKDNGKALLVPLHWALPWEL
jgi:hypothetical protein